jgi:hypothetical protein
LRRKVAGDNSGYRRRFLDRGVSLQAYHCEAIRRARIFTLKLSPPLVFVSNLAADHTFVLTRNATSRHSLYKLSLAVPQVRLDVQGVCRSVRIPGCTRVPAILLFAFYSASVTTAAEFEKLSVPEGLEIKMDPMKSINVSEPFNITNGAKSSNLDLRLDRFVAASTHLPPHGATARLIPNGIESTKGQLENLTSSTLAPKKTIVARIEIAGFVESGDYSVTLYNGPMPLSSIKVTGAPFKVHTEAATGTAMPVIVGPDSLQFAIRNDDTLTYPVHWELTFGSATIQRDAILHPGATEISYDQKGNREQTWTLPEDRWDSICRYLRDSAYDGHLRVTLARPGSSEEPSKPDPFAPTATFPVKVSLRHQSPELTTIIGSLVLVLVLTLGAIASLIATLYIPHTLRKNALRSRLILAIRRIRELSADMPSRGRISAEVDCFQIAGRLRNEGAFYSDFDAILQDYETQVSAVERRVALMSQVDRCQQILEGINTLAVPLSLITMAHEPLEQLNKMFDGGEWTDEQLRAAAALADTLQHRVSNLSDVKSSGKIDADVQNKIKSELTRVKACFCPSRTGFGGRLADALPGIFAILDGTPTDIPDTPWFDWAQLDVALWKLRMVWRFVRAYDATNNPDWRTRLEEKAGLSGGHVCKGSLLYYLELSTWDALNCAELLCTQVDQGIFPEDICKAITDGRFSIQILQKQVTSERRVDVEISFSNYAYNNASARYEIMPRWTFTPRHPRSLRTRLWNRLKNRPDTAEPRRETGWVVSCLARPYRSVEARVSFEDWYGELRVNGDDERTRATYPIESNATGLVWPRFLMEVSKLALGLTIPILGLLAGAREKLLTMDVSAALATVFVLGFGADTIKSALTRGTVTTPGPTPPKSLATRSAAATEVMERTPVLAAR